MWERKLSGNRAPKPEDSNIDYYVPFSDISRDTWIVEQCTGHKDINGILIYEGDILASRGNYYHPDWVQKDGTNPDVFVQVVWSERETALGVTDKPDDVDLDSEDPYEDDDRLWQCSIDTFREIIAHRLNKPVRTLGRQKKKAKTT